MIRSKLQSPFFMVLTFSVILFSGYFLFQANDYLFGPELMVASPQDGETIHGSVVVRGTTNPSVRLTINGYETYSDQEGVFEERFPFGQGFHIIEIVVENRFGREARITRNIVVK